MKETIATSLACLAMLVALGASSACGDDENSTGGTGGAGASTSSSSSMGGMGGMAGAGGMTSSSTGGGEMINGCNSATAEDHTADAAVTITFGPGFTYSPACIRIKSGTAVTFEGAFTTHPLSGGTAGSPPTPDATSPIVATNSGTSAVFTLEPAGTYPYYCDFHQPSMAGAIFVE